MQVRAGPGLALDRHLCIGSEQSTCPSSHTAHVWRLNKADVLALNEAHVLLLNTKPYPVFTANTKETTKAGEAAEGRLLCVGCGLWAYLSVET